MTKISAGVKWINTVAILKAQSNEWAEIVEASKNIINYGVPFPNKQQQKELAEKKDIEDVNSNTKNILPSIFPNFLMTSKLKYTTPLEASSTIFPKHWKERG